MSENIKCDDCLIDLSDHYSGAIYVYEGFKYGGPEITFNYCPGCGHKIDWDKLNEVR